MTGSGLAPVTRRDADYDRRDAVRSWPPAPALELIGRAGQRARISDLRRQLLARLSRERERAVAPQFPREADRRGPGPRPVPAAIS